MGKRLDLKTGFVCNNNCRFCVQAHKKEFGNRDKEELLTELKDARKNCDSVVFTGGEVTLREDIFELISYAKQLGYKIIQLQSNVRMLFYMQICKKLVKAGVNEFSPALHGHTAELHDYLTRAKGSFNQTTKAIQNLKELDQYIIINSVVVKPNYKHLPELARMLVGLGVHQYQLAFMHAVGNAWENIDEMMPKVSKAAPYIHKALQIGIDSGVKCMAEAMPFCQMKGYEKYCSEHFIPSTEIRDRGSMTEFFEKTRVKDGKKKFSKCKECKWDCICEGPWREYPEKFGDEEFQPVKS
ncbi:MAG: radical SAM protein [Candidatus Nanoarchaeia archaeon]